MTKESMIKVLRHKAEHIKTRIKPEFFSEVADALEQQPCEDKIIEWKKDFKEYINALSMPRDDYKGIMEYIDELPVAPQEPCKDAISRAEAVKVASGYCHPSNIAKELAKLPPVTPIKPKGHWKESNRDACPECSICGELQDYKSDFCPNCGAEMMNVPDKNDGKLSEIPIGSESEE